MKEKVADCREDGRQGALTTWDVSCDHDAVDLSIKRQCMTTTTCCRHSCVPHEIERTAASPGSLDTIDFGILSESGETDR